MMHNIHNYADEIFYVFKFDTDLSFLSKINLPKNEEKKKLTTLVSNFSDVMHSNTAG